MYIYAYNKDFGTLEKFNVKQQLCAKCLLQHTKNNLNNNNLTGNVYNILCENREEISSNVENSNAVFVFPNNNKLLLVLKNIRPVTQEEMLMLKTLMPGIKLEQTSNNFINTDFHNHNHANISLQLSDNKKVLIVHSNNL